MLGKQIKSRAAVFNGPNELEDDIIRVKSKCEAKFQQRPQVFLSKELGNRLKAPKENILDKITIREGDSVIIDRSRESVGLFESIDSVLCIDTPKLFIPFSNPDKAETNLLHWREVLKIFEADDEDKQATVNPPAQAIIDSVGQVVGGKVVSVESSVPIVHQHLTVFEDHTKRRLFLPEVAPGMQSFAILQRLLQKVLLDSKTQLIIEEPEARLHPQWVVENARLLIEIHEKLGTHFLVASHSTDFVESVANIADGYFIKPTYYLSTPSEENEWMYVFEDTKDEIEPIFKVFNKAYERMAYYIDPFA